MGIHPAWFVAFGVAWLILVGVIVAMAHVAGRSDEALEREQREHAGRGNGHLR